MSARFNPPPGWPVPPAGWIPDSTWEPDPSWPAPPAGWPMWVDDTVTEPREETMLLPLAGLASVGPTTGPRQDNRTRRIVLIAFLCLAFLVLGLLLGKGRAGSQLAAAETTLEEVQTERARVEEDKAALLTAQEDLATAQATMTEREGAVGTKEAELVTRESAAAAAETDLQSRLTVVEGRESAVATAEADLQARSAAAGRSGTSSSTPKATTPDAPAGIVGGGGGSVSYANCDAVRAAGKAPIRVGEPGYSKKLDRDGDGVGCE